MYWKRGSLVGLCLLLAPGCSTFNRDWKAWKAAGSLDLPEDSAVGLWEGTWLSESTGHSGDLRCILTRQGTTLEDLTGSGGGPAPSGDPGGPHIARFKAWYGGIFPFEQTLELESTEEPSRFRGEADLGWLLGIYRYEGQKTANRLIFTYRAESDHGTFELEKLPLGESESGDRPDRAVEDSP